MSNKRHRDSKPLNEGTSKGNIRTTTSAGRQAPPPPPPRQEKIMSKLRVGCGAWGNIYAGTVKKDNTWGANRTDVTNEAISAVAQSLLQKEEKLIFKSRERDGKTFVLEVREATEEEELKPEE